MAKLRVEKVQELLREEVSKIILQGLKDPHIGFVTVTSVKMSADLKNAKIYISLFGTEQEKKDSFKALKRATGYIRREIGKRVRLQFTPEIAFYFDETLAYGMHINELLAKIKRDEVREDETIEGGDGAKTPLQK